MFWGTGKPKVQILKWDGTVMETVTLPLPSARSPIPWEREHDDRFNPVTKNLVLRQFGWRYRCRMYFSGFVAAGDDNFENLIKVVNWGTEQPLRLWPHLDQGISYLVHVTDARAGHHSMTTKIDEIEIEFTAIELIAKIPNLDLKFSGNLRGITK